MTGSLFDPHGAYLGPVPDWLTIPDVKDGCRTVVMNAPFGAFPMPMVGATPLVTMALAQLTFELTRHRNGALRYRMADQATLDAFTQMREHEERW